MLKLIIADDERIIRETISTIIDWKKYDIELVGLCKNGLEAYDMILDESPDIVLTDIRMPGMDAMELIEKTSEIDSPPQFILLSGYGEFEYAKRAMKYGVKHYLLKPCHESQILESIRDVAKDCYQKYSVPYRRQDQFQVASNMAHDVMFSMIHDTIYRNQPYEEIFRTFEPFLDFHFTHYQLIYIYFLEEPYLEAYLSRLSEYCRREMPYVTVHGIYTRNTLIIFFRDCAIDYDVFLSFLTSVQLPAQQVRPEAELISHRNLYSLLPTVLDKVRRYTIIYYIHSFHVISCCNYNVILDELEQLYASIFNGDMGKMENLTKLLDEIHDLKFLKQISSSLFLKIALNNQQVSTAELTDFLIILEQETEFSGVKKSIIRYLESFLEKQKNMDATSVMVRQIFEYVEQNISSSSLTLKYISEQILFMNTDYVSRKFQRETGVKFSTYLTSVRIRKAKEYLAASDPEKIQNVAKMVGCGNNPQYFSQLFRKQTGMTPSAYSAMLHGKGE